MIDLSLTAEQDSLAAAVRTPVAARIDGESELPPQDHGYLRGHGNIDRMIVARALFAEAARRSTTG